MRLFLPSITAIAIVVGACADLTTRPDRRSSEQVYGPTASTGLPGSAEFQLLACPTAEASSARAIIGPAGGTITVAGSSITIPFGAVPVPTEFEVMVPASSYMEVEIHAVGMERYVFLRPATVTIDYSRCPADAVPANAALQGVHIDTLTKQVLELMGGAADRDDHTVRFPTGHLSGYAVAY